MIPQLTNHLWQSTLFALAATLLTLAFRRNRAHVRYWLWFSASFKFFLPFALLMSLGSHLGRLTSTRQISAPSLSDAVVVIAQPFTRNTPSAPAPVPAGWMPVAALALWTCGFAAIILVRFQTWRRIRATVRSAVPLEIPAQVEARSSPGLLEPGVVGLWRPILLLPQGIPDRLTQPQLESILAHELCHVRRRDNLLASIHMIVEALFWFHPLVWWIGARLVEERERACDEDVLHLGSEPRIYADAILSVCRLYVESPLVCVSGVTGSDLKRRIEAIMLNRKGKTLNRARKFLLAGAGTAALVCPVAVGVIVAFGHAPAVRAQSPAANQRLVAMLFDFGSMTSDQQSKAQQSAIDFVNNSMKPGDAVAVMSAESGNARIVQDFTRDPSTLQSAIRNLGPAGGTASGLSGIEAASKLLAVFPGKKSLVYFSAATGQPGMDNRAALQAAIDTAKQSNVAIYPVDGSGLIPKMLAQASPAGGGRSMAPPTAPAGLSQDEFARRQTYAQEHFGSPSSVMGRTYIKYGPPDGIEDGRSPAQIWRYNYLENFHSNVEFEFTPWNGRYNMRIKWPLPAVTYEGGPSANATELPGRHASFQIYPSSQSVEQILSVPLDALSGHVEIEARIAARPAGGAEGQTVASIAGLRDSVQAEAGDYQANFVLPAGSYACAVIVRAQATGQTYGETVNFEVK